MALRIERGVTPMPGRKEKEQHMKHKTLRTLLCVILTVCFCLSAIAPVSAAGLFSGDSGAASIFDEWIRSLKDRFIEKNPGTDETPAEPMAGTGTDGFYRIVHLDCGRKYFSVENIKKLIDVMAQYGYNQLQLAFGNDGFRFLLDDMSLSFKVGTSTTPIKFTSDEIKQNITAGNQEYNGDTRYLSETDMDNILAYAKEKGIDIVPMLNMPGHARVIVKNTEYGDNGNLNVDSEVAREYGYAILKKYVDYFSGKGCKYFHFGSDESGYTGNNMTKFLAGCADVITKAGMIPRAFNDATNVATMPTSVQITYWHQENNSKTAYALNQDGYQLINTHGRWYYVIKPAQGSEIGTKYWEGRVNSSTVSVELPVMKAEKMDGKWVGLKEYFDANPGYGSTISASKGVMFCIWCDASEDKYLTDSDVISENENYGALYQLKKLAEHYWADDINKDPVDPVNPTEKVVNIKVGESVSYNVTDSTVDAGDKIVGNEAYIAEAVVAKTEEVAETTVSTTKATTVEDGASYILRVYDTNYALTTNPGQTVWQESTSTLKFETYTAAEDDNVWTLEASDTGYKLNSKAGYLNLGAIVNNASVGTTGEVFELVYTSTGWTIKNPSELYINALGGVENYHSAGGWTDGSTRFDLYKVTQATDATTTLTITGTGEGTTIVTIGGIKYTINVTAPDVTETKSLTYGGSFALPTGAVVTEAPTSGVTVADGKVTAENADAEVTVKAVTKNAGGYVTKRYIYNVTVSNVDFSGVDPLSVELWITNRYAGGTHNGVTYPATAAGHVVTVSAESAYGADGVLLEDFVPTRGVDEGNLPLLFWKGTRLAYENRQEYTGNDKTGSGNDFLRVRYYENSWQYYSNSAWNAVLSTDQIIAYYMQVYNTSPEIVTAFRDYGGIAGDGGGEYDANWFAGYRGVATAVVYSDKSMSPDGDDGIWNNTLICYYEGASGGGTPGLIKVFDTDDFKITKISITKGVHKDSTGATGADATKTWNRTTSSVAWDKTVNDAGDEWYDETLIWDREKDYTGGTIQLDDTIWGDKWKTSGIGEAFLLLFYVEPVQKDENLNIVYWDDNANTQINPTDITISVKKGVTFLNIQQTSPVNTGTFVLDDDATIENSIGVHRKFNKNITILEGVAANYRSGIYAYRSADISTDGKTLTLHYNLKVVADKHTYVVDFGLPLTFTDILKSFFDIKDANTVEYLSVAKSNKLTESTGSFGSVVIDTVGKTDGNGNPIPPYDTMTYTLDQKKTVSAPIYIPLYLKILGTDELRSTQIELIPASNVYYEETFITNPENSGWTNAGTADSVNQTLEEAGKKQNVYGYDTQVENYNIEQSAITYSMGGAYQATLAIPEGKDFVNTPDKLTFTFKGTGFDLISGCGANTGMLTVNVLNSAGKRVKTYVVDTYLHGDETIMPNGTITYQVPVVRNMSLTYDTYTVTVYGSLWDTSGAVTKPEKPTPTIPTASTASRSMDAAVSATVDTNSVLRDMLDACGLADVSLDEVELVYMDENSILNGGAGEKASVIERAEKLSSANIASLTAEGSETAQAEDITVWVDAFRVYNPSGTTDVQAYTDDKEAGVTYSSLYDYVKENKDSVTQNDNAVMYIEYNGSLGIADIASYKKWGPENEIYLAPGTAIAFGLATSGTDSIVQISAKIVSGDPTIKIGDDATITLNATEMYYDLKTNNRISSSTSGDTYIVIENISGEGVLAVSGLKLKNATTNAMSETTKTEILKSFAAKSSEGFEPTVFEVSVPQTARKNRNFAFGVSASANDVQSVTIQMVSKDDTDVSGEIFTLTPSNTKAVASGFTSNYSYSKVYKVKEAGTYTFAITAYGVGGSKTITKTVVVK